VFGFSVPLLFFWILVILPAITSIYYGAVVTGMYKDPLMARFRTYGIEKRPAPLCWFLVSLGLWCIALMLLLEIVVVSAGLYALGSATTIFGTLAVMALAGSVVVWRERWLREALPIWYYDLLRQATRDERRLIGFAWLRIPRRMRWRLNGDQAAFRTWADTVRITVIYGAYDPNNPWQAWG
jgi:hypothetical protein